MQEFGEACLLLLAVDLLLHFLGLRAGQVASAMENKKRKMPHLIATQLRKVAAFYRSHWIRVCMSVCAEDRSICAPIALAEFDGIPTFFSNYPSATLTV